VCARGCAGRYDGPAEFSFNYSALKANVQWYINTIVEVQVSE
jgi:hypothetical protein